MASINQPSSAFIRRLNQVMGGVQPRIGFRTQQIEVIPALLIVVTLPGLDPRLVEAAVNGGANAVQVRMNLQDESGDASVLRSLLDAAGECPLGVLLAGTSGTSKSRMESWRSGGADFVVLGADSDPAVLGLSGVGKVVSIDHTVGVDLIRSIHELPIDAVEASLATPDEVGKPLTIRELLRYRSASTLVRRPIVVRADFGIGPEHVAALRDAGVEALSIDATQTGSDPQSIRETTARYIQAVKELGVPRGRGVPPIYPSIPNAGPATRTHVEPEEEPDEE